ncbi:MAG: hypothetical protein ACMG57_05470 [Candidatus Dojkabacteria bacterium]
MNGGQFNQPQQISFYRIPYESVESLFYKLKGERDNFIRLIHARDSRDSEIAKAEAEDEEEFHRKVYTIFSKKTDLSCNYWRTDLVHKKWKGVEMPTTFDVDIHLRDKIKSVNEIKIPISLIKRPDVPSERPILGLLLPNSPAYFRELRRKFTGHVKIYFADGRTQDVNVEVKQGNYQEIMGTFELGQMLEGSIGITLDLNTGESASPIYDPSAEF